MPLPVIAAALIRGAATVARVVGPLLARGAAAAGSAVSSAASGAAGAARAVGSGAMSAGRAFVGSFQAAPQLTRAVLGMPQKPMAAAASSAQSAAPALAQQAVRQTVNVNAAGGAGPAGQGGNQHFFGPLMRLIGGGSGNSGQAATQAVQAGQQAAQQSSMATKANNAQSASSRWMQRGAQLYQSSRIEGTRERQRDWVDMNKNLGAGMEAARNFDPKSLQFFAKAASLAFKSVATSVMVPGGILAVLALLPKKLRDFGDALVEARRPLAEINGSMAGAYARLDVQRFQRNVRFAGATSGSSIELTRALSKLEDRLLPFGIAITNILNSIASTILDSTARVVGALEDMDPGAVLRDIKKNTAKEETPAVSDLAEFATAVRDGKFNKRVKPPSEPVESGDDRTSRAGRSAGSRGGSFGV